ncbi:MAG: sugar ABC transporter substrate-binding protein [Anaerolineae bacterium]|nr:sugar ABC transporter substrate-binding protein [Anaerolineae bacterium]
MGTRTKCSKLLYATVCLLAFVLSGCQGGAVEPTVEPIAITFIYPSYDTEFYQALLREFNASYPQITVELVPVRQSNYEVDPQTVDVFIATPYHVMGLQEQGDILNLSPIIEQSLSFNSPDFYPGVLEAFSNEEGIWAVPLGVDPLVMYYNKDLFDSAGATYPRNGWAWEDFLDAALAVTDLETNTFGYISTPDSADPLLFVYQHGGRLLDSLENPTRTTFDDPLTIDAVEWYADLVLDHNVIPTPDQMREAFPGGQGVSQAIRFGRIGMWVDSLSERGGQDWRRNWDMEWGVVGLPRDLQSITLIGTEGYFISSHTQNREACWRWVSFLSEQPPSRMAPARRSTLESDAYEQEAGSEVAAAARDSLGNAVMISPRLAAFGEVLEETFFSAIDAILEEGATTEEALAVAQGEAEYLLEQ